MKNVSHPNAAHCASCAEVHITPDSVPHSRQDNRAALLPAYPMLVCAMYGRLHAEQAGQELDVDSGNCALFKAGEKVSLHAMGKVPLTLAYAELANQEDGLFDAYRLPLLLNNIDIGRTHDYLDQFLAFQAQSGTGEPSQPYEGALLRNGLMLLVLQALKHQTDAVQQAAPSEELQKIRAYCLKNLANKITLADLQKVLSISASPLCTLVKKAAGMSPMAYVRQMRLEHALQLLQNSHKRVHEIAAKCGFPNAFHFSRTFKQCYGLSPSEYRSQAFHKPLSQGDLLMRQQRHTEAISAYQEQWDAERDTPAGNEVRYKLGLAFYRDEQYDDALQHWQILRDTPYWLKAIPDIVDILFKFGQFEVGAQLFKEHCAEAQEAGVHKAFHTLWLKWLRTLRQQRDGDHVEMLLQIRADLFPTDEGTAYEAGISLLARGRGSEVDPRLPLYAAGLRKAGRYQEIVDSPYCERKHKVNALLLMGKYQAIIDDYRDFQSQYAQALGQLGKAKTGLQLFAPDSEAYAISLFYNGEYDRILRDYRQFRTLCCHVCYMRKEPERIITERIANFWQAVPALCLLGRTREARDYIQGHLNDRPRLTITEAIQMLLQGDRSGAEAALVPLLQTVRSSPEPRIRALPAYMVLMHLQNDSFTLAELEDTVRIRDYEDHQDRYWFDARFVAGAVDEKAYLAQPQQHPDPHKSLPLFQAIRHDLAGHAAEAIENYNVIFERYSQNMPFFAGYESWHWYIKWRLQELVRLPKE